MLCVEVPKADRQNPEMTKSAFVAIGVMVAYRLSTIKAGMKEKDQAESDA